MMPAAITPGQFARFLADWRDRRAAERAATDRPLIIIDTALGHPRGPAVLAALAARRRANTGATT
tara:strand:+ start:21077 stop:21271 length:195 start_codon:yes stop_codon:yes gene_type:complete